MWRAVLTAYVTLWIPYQLPFNPPWWAISGTLVHPVDNLLSASLVDATKEECGDRALVMTAVKSKGGAIGFASDELKKDHDVVLTAVKAEGSTNALRYADESMRGKKDVVLTTATTTSTR